MSSTAVSPKTGAIDKKDLNKYIKKLVFKSIQVVVQSRLGDKVQTNCRPHNPGSDWFSLSIQDLPDVFDESNKVLQGDTVSSWLPMCVEISLKTNDGDQMLLENWQLGLLPEQCDPAFKMPCTIYSRMSLMLKSLLSVTRVTPAYKLSRRQNDDSFVIYYRIHQGEPQLQDLGEGYRHFRIGQLCTPVGTIFMSVVYRTKMTITPIHVPQEGSIMVKSDHFRSEASPKQIRYSKSNDKKKVNLDEPMKAGAFVDISKIKPFESDFILPEIPPFSWLLEDTRKSDPSDSPFGLKDECFETELDLHDNSSTSPTSGDNKSVWSIGPDDDKLMKELNLPFATPGPVGELARFFREFYNPPPLQSFSDANSDGSKSPSKEEGETINITEQLELFETSQHEYDEMVSSLCHSSNNN